MQFDRPHRRLPRINLIGSRREFLNGCGMGLGAIALSTLLHQDEARSAAGYRRVPELAAKAKSVIYLFQSGAPSQVDLFDYKPLLNRLHGQELPERVRQGQRLTAMSGNQASLPLAGSPFKFRQFGESGAWLSDLLPHTASVIDNICFMKSLYTEAINHGPAITFLQTGSQFPGRPSMGAWVDYGLGTENENLPGFVVLVTKNKGGQPLVSRLWGNGFLPTRHQGVRFRSGRDPVLYLNNPDGLPPAVRRTMLDRLGELHRLQLNDKPDRQLEAKIAQYELAYRMQQSIPEAANLADEPRHVLDEYGEDAADPGSYASNCLLARRLVERGVRFIQLYHQGWDQHGDLANGITRQCRETDQPTAALIRDLKRRGLLDQTLVVWGGEFGRTNYCQGKLTPQSFGRDHHPRCFSMWLAGGGVKAGITYGSTDEFSYNIAEDPVHIHDLQATILRTLGVDHRQLTFKHQGRRYRLTDVHGRVIDAVLR